MRFHSSAMLFQHIQSAFQQVLNADASQCVVADGLSAGEVAMAEPLAVCLHATRRAGADFIVTTDLSDFTVKMAKQIGAHMAINIAYPPDGLDRFGADKGTFDYIEISYNPNRKHARNEMP